MSRGGKWLDSSGSKLEQQSSEMSTGFQNMCSFTSLSGKTVEHFEMGKDSGFSCPSGLFLPYIVFGLLYNSVHFVENSNKIIGLQMHISCVRLIIALWTEQFLHQFINLLQHFFSAS